MRCICDVPITSLKFLTGYEDSRAAIAAHFARPEAPLTAKVSYPDFSVFISRLKHRIAPF